VTLRFALTFFTSYAHASAPPRAIFSNVEFSAVRHR